MDNPELRLIPLDTKYSYYASNMGCIYRLLKHKPRPHQRIDNKIYVDGDWYCLLSPYKRGKKRNYDVVKLVMNNESQKSFPVHRLIALTFLPNPKTKNQINHINGIYDDNRVCNLEWASNRENLEHAQDIGLRRKVDHGYVENLLRFSYLSQREIADKTNCSITLVEKIKSISKVQRPERYKASSKMVKTRSKLVGTKWYRNGENSLCS